MTEFKEKTIIDPQGNIFAWREICHPRYKYELTKNYHVMLQNVYPDIIGEYYVADTKDYVTNLIIRKGYQWDGASGPTIDTINTMRASCVHDVLYQMMRQKELAKIFKDDADQELKKIMEEDWKPKTILGKIWNKVRAGYFYYAVKLFGGSFCRSKK